MSNYLPILIFVLVAIGFLIVTLLASRLARYGNVPTTNLEAYECGNPPETLAHDHPFSVRYYLIAVLFVIFDVETVFLYPWAVMFDRLAWFGFIEMVIFLVILISGYAFIWRRGALDWA